MSLRYRLNVHIPLFFITERWIWEHSSEPMVFSNWGSTYPNHTEKNLDDCVCLDPEFGLEYSWRDTDCNDGVPEWSTSDISYICQKEDISVSTTQSPYPPTSWSPGTELALDTSSQTHTCKHLKNLHVWCIQ